MDTYLVFGHNFNFKIPLFYLGSNLVIWRRGKDLNLIRIRLCLSRYNEAIFPPLGQKVKNPMRPLESTLGGQHGARLWRYFLPPPTAVVLKRRKNDFLDSPANGGAGPLHREGRFWVLDTPPSPGGGSGFFWFP